MSEIQPNSVVSFIADNLEKNGPENLRPSTNATVARIIRNCHVATSGYEPTTVHQKIDRYLDRIARLYHLDKDDQPTDKTVQQVLLTSQKTADRQEHTKQATVCNAQEVAAAIRSARIGLEHYFASQLNILEQADFTTDMLANTLLFSDER